MANTARDVGPLEKAVNDTAGKAAVLWTSFLTVGAYLLIATGSVKHRDLFLDAAIRLPVLGVDLPVTGYFLFAPLIFLIFHFYVFLQLTGLSEKVADYNLVLNESVKIAADRRIARRRLDDFPLLQFLAGVRERRTGLPGLLQLAISWITIVLFPIVIFLQLQIAFLPYHSAPITWLHRVCLIIDLAVIWVFWRSFRNDVEVGKGRRLVNTLVGVVATTFIVTFSVFLATFPGERIYRNVVARAVDATVSRVVDDNAISASRLLFEGDVDGVSGRPSLFANRIIVPGERFYDEAKHEKAEVSVLLRGRDLRGAILSYADLRRADFTGASLVDASFAGAKLQGTRFGCAARLSLEASIRAKKRTRADSCDQERAADLRGADFSEAVLHGAFVSHAKLHGARFTRAMMQGVSAEKADLTASLFSYAQLQGASLADAELIGASFTGAQMQGADLRGASLRLASLLFTQLQGAHLGGATLDLATFRSANLYRAFVDPKEHEGALFHVVSAKPTYPRIQDPSVRRDSLVLRPAGLDSGGFEAFKQWSLEGVQGTVTRQSVSSRLSVIDPARKITERQFESDLAVSSDQSTAARIRLERVKEIGELICEQDGAPHVARGLIYNGRVLGSYELRATIEDDPALGIIRRLRGDDCPGAIGLDVNDFRELARIERQILQIKERERKRSGKDDDDDDDK